MDGPRSSSASGDGVNSRDEASEDFQHPIEPLPKQLGTGPVGKAALAAGAAALNAAVPGISVPTAGVAAALQALGEKLNKQQEARLLELLESASRETALTAEEVVKQLTEREDLVLLAAEAIDAARRSRLLGKAAALGRCLGSILNDDARVETESIWLRIIATVEPAHLRLLKSFMHRSRISSEQRPASRSSLAVRTASLIEAAWDLGLTGITALPLVQDLVKCGLIWTEAPSQVKGTLGQMNDQEIHVTLLASQLLRRLAEAAES